MKVLGLVIALALAPAAHAAATAGQSTALQKAVACRAMSDPAARVACYDAAVDALQQAQARGDVVVVDAERAEAVRRQNFGLAEAPPPFPIPEKAEPVERVSLTVARAWRAADGDWMLAMTDGQVWRQIDGRFPRAPKTGSTAEIQRALLGSYLMKIDGQIAVRARREK